MQSDFDRVLLLLLFSLFAQWLSVLDIIAKALFDNNMEFSQINGIHKFQVRVNLRRRIE